MAAEILTALIGFNLAVAAAILLAVLLRRPARRLFGARVAYGLWLLPPLAGLASLLPPRQANALLVEPAPLRPIAEYTVERIETVMSLGQGQLALLAAWGIGALLAVSLLTWRQRASMALLGRLTREGKDLVRAANPAVGPAVVGFIWPRIILPADFESRFDVREQAVIIAHERAHLAAWDVRINALAALARCILWFNPLIHLAAHLVRIDQEIACDETVVARHPGDRRAYAQALLKAQVKPAPLPLGCYWPGRSPHLKERLLMLTRKSPSRRVRLAGAAIVGLAGLGAAYAAWAAQPQQDVLIKTTAPLVLAQADVAAPTPGVPHEAKQVTITRNGETRTYEGDAIPAEIQAEIDKIGPGPGSLSDTDGTLVIHEMRVLGPYPGRDPGVNWSLTNFFGNGAAARIAAVASGPGVVKLHCQRNGAGKPAACDPIDGEPADQAKALADLAAAPIISGDDRAEDFYLVVRYPR
jgi:beta-lactamase regulating signal transducer with metallopeptidase domain